MYELFVNLICITEHQSILNTKVGHKAVQFRQVSL
jgi:hypothetical protein